MQNMMTSPDSMIYHKNNEFLVSLMMSHSLLQNENIYHYEGMEMQYQ